MLEVFHLQIDKLIGKFCRIQKIWNHDHSVLKHFGDSHTELHLILQVKYKITEEPIWFLEVNTSGYRNEIKNVFVFELFVVSVFEVI